jgi:type II secretory pathway pseudopilin PulG
MDRGTEEGAMRRNHLRGITLIELLVVVAVVGVLVLLLLPAIQSARAQARQASCINNLSQIGLALHNYHTATLCLPMSQVWGEGHGNGHSVFALLLPYLEQIPLYNAYNFDLENWHEANSTAVGPQLETFLCPDNPRTANVAAGDVRSPRAGKTQDTEARFPESHSTFGMAHYAANWGGGRGSWGEDYLKQRGDYLGVMMTVITPDGKEKAPDGEPKARMVRFADITDGTALTLAMAEKRDSFGWAVGGWGGSEFDVHTQANYEGDDPLARKVYTGADHPDGVCALMCDGSVRRLTPKLDRAVWYALTTRAGCEEIKPDVPGISAILSTAEGLWAEAAHRLDLTRRSVDQLVRQLKQHEPRPAAAKSRMTLYLLDLQDGQVTRVAAEPDPNLDQCGSPSWAQDGRRILYDAQPRNQLPRTRLKAIDLADGRLVQTDLGPGNCPTSSPKGDRVVFLLNPEQMPNAEVGVWIMNGDGSGRRLLGGYGRPKWSPDGHQFMIISFSNPCEVTVIDDRPGRRSGILDLLDRKIYSIPAWAGDATIVAVLGETAGEEIALVDVTSPQEGRIKEVLWTKGKGLDVKPREPIYSPVTGLCVFVGEDAKGMALYSFKHGKTDPPRRLEPEAYDNLIRDLAFSPDGRYILFSSNRPDRPRPPGAGQGKDSARAATR